jgi:diacylglycerol kinase (ATP)
MGHKFIGSVFNYQYIVSTRQKKKKMISLFVNRNAAVRSHKIVDLNPYIDFLKNNKTDYQINFCDSVDDIDFFLKKDIENGIRDIFTYGGDGSMHHLINEIYQSNPNLFSELRLGLIPAGTGNDWMRNFSSDSFYSLKCLTENKTASLDIGKINYENGDEKLFFNLSGIGFNGAVIQRIDKYKFLRKLSYYAALIDTFFRYKSETIKLKIENKIIEKEVFLVSLGIGKYAGGNMKLCPNAILDDGLFDINIIEKISLWKLITNLHTLTDGTYLQRVKSISQKASKLEIIENKYLRAEADGEYIGNGISSFEIKEKFVRFYV